MKPIPLGEQFTRIIKHRTEVSDLSQQLEQNDLSKVLNEPAFQHLMRQTPSIIGIFNFQKQCFDFFNEAVYHEWGYDPEELTGESNLNFAMDICVPDHGLIFVNNFVTDVMDTIVRLKTAIDISYTICLQLRKKNGKASWYYMETNILAVNESGMPLYSIFNGINVDQIKKDSQVYYAIRRKNQDGINELIFSTSMPTVNDDCFLSLRELEVLRYLQNGFSTEKIAGLLSISTHTVTSHRKNLLFKTQSENTADLLSLAMLRGWL